jgi:serine/threonine protein kinase
MVELADDVSASLPVLSGEWETLAELGRGGMGTVYRVRHKQINAEAAVKVLNHFYAHRPEIVARFRQEAIAANAIDNHGIVRIFDCGQLPSGEPYFFMEYLKGENLRDWLSSRKAKVGPDAASKEAGSDTWDHCPQIAHIGQQIASVMASAHKQKIIHRDLKLDNIMVLKDDFISGGNRVKILDFGIAKVAWESEAEGAERDAHGHLVFTGVTEAGVTQPGSLAVVPVSPPAPTQPDGTLPMSGGAREEEAQAAHEVQTPPPPVTVVSPAPPAVAMILEDLPASPDSSPSPGTAAPKEKAPRGRAPSTCPIPPRSAGASEPRWKPGSPINTDPNLARMGTVGYAAPEQMRAAKMVDGKADVYSLGVILYEAIEGRLPEPKEPLLSKENSSLAKLIKEMLSERPEHRPLMEEVSDRLRKILGRSPDFDRAFKTWIASGKSDSLLPRGRDLEGMQAWAEKRDDLITDEREMLARAKKRQEKRKQIYAGLSLAAVFAMLGGMVLALLSHEELKAAFTKAQAVLVIMEAESKRQEGRAKKAIQMAEEERKKADEIIRDSAEKEKIARDSSFEALVEVIKATGQTQKFQNILEKVRLQKKAAEEAQQVAQIQRDKAEIARADAENARAQDEAARQQAEEAKSIAEKAKHDAEVAAEKANIAKSDAEKRAREAEERAKKAEDEEADAIKKRRRRSRRRSRRRRI